MLNAPATTFYIGLLPKEDKYCAVHLADFQSGWIWDDTRIKALIAGVTSNFPVGAAMFLEYGNKNIRFKYRVVEVSPAQNIVPSELILDGQKRLTSLYSSLYRSNPVNTKTDKVQDIKMQYKIPVITLDKDTPKEAVCQVFENVNTGDVSLTVFELVTAIFAMDIFELRKEWKNHFWS